MNIATVMPFLITEVRISSKWRMDSKKEKQEDENLIVCDIEMQGEKRSIKYTGKHFLALQKAIGFYDDYIKKKTDTVKDESDG